MQKLTWYFDFISPFAYIQFKQFSRLPDDTQLELKPILLAGLLKHWNNVGPAEVPPKRTFTYQHCHWRAHQLNISFKMPPNHPFNSLLGLRLAIACENDPSAIETIFNVIWQEGMDLNSREAESYLAANLPLKNIQSAAANTNVKERLRTNTEQAAAEQVFGVPSFVTQDTNKMMFWGLDAFDMLLDYLQSKQFFESPEMQRLKNLPEGIQRKR
ncbi:2-hydroxychromene-2-carboxylate isomerase [Aliikangiella marina]|uniref:2-hydroxychromene-2-carboxylate isomerase n=1 Tax=Aliikangiella marina TaxID=1712262 RepID=A0A545T8Y7_9GAMM|nr:2-hydroxychromene-2-carboxylate isomerase [Aliikangiella marina]TQV73682.1 2-hydroxychromene-2-carboxylate isomerase [Aliikangiella marina]